MNPTVRCPGTGRSSNGTIYNFRFLALLPRLPGVKQYAGLRLWGDDNHFIGNIMGFVSNGNITAQNAAPCPPSPPAPSPEQPSSSPHAASYSLPVPLFGPSSPALPPMSPPPSYYYQVHMKLALVTASPDCC